MKKNLSWIETAIKKDNKQTPKSEKNKKQETNFFKRLFFVYSGPKLP